MGNLYSMQNGARTPEEDWAHRLRHLIGVLDEALVEASKLAKSPGVVEVVAILEKMKTRIDTRYIPLVNLMCPDQKDAETKKVDVKDDKAPVGEVQRRKTFMERNFEAVIKAVTSLSDVRPYKYDYRNSEVKMYPNGVTPVPGKAQFIFKAIARDYSFDMAVTPWQINMSKLLMAMESEHWDDIKDDLESLCKSFPPLQR